MHYLRNEDYFPFEIVRKSMLVDFHTEVVIAERWDLVPESRFTIRLCLN